MIGSHFKSSLIITVYNQAKQLNLVLKTVSQQTCLTDEIIITDDGSSDNTNEIVNYWKNKLPVPIIYLWHEDVGFTKSVAQNNAIKAAKGEYLIFIDGDMLLHPNFIRNHLRYAHKNKILCGYRGVKLKESFTGMLLSDYLQINKNTLRFINIFLQRFSFNPRFSIELKNKTVRALLVKKRAGLSGGNFSTYKSNLLKVNGFDESIVEYGFEDYDLGCRLKLTGCYMVNMSNLCITYHLYHSTKKNPGESKKRVKFSQRNKFYVENGIVKMQ